jgi:hypothetical protein
LVQGTFEGAQLQPCPELAEWVRRRNSLIFCHPEPTSQAAEKVGFDAFLKGRSFSCAVQALYLSSRGGLQADEGSASSTVSANCQGMKLTVRGNLATRNCPFRDLGKLRRVRAATPNARLSVSDQPAPDYSPVAPRHSPPSSKVGKKENENL